MHEIMPLELSVPGAHRGHVNPASSECVEDIAPQPRLTIARNRLAASLHFLADGMIFGTWATLIPTFKTRFGLSEAEIGIALLGMVVGAITSMPVAGHRISRHGSRANLVWLAPAFCIALILLVAVPNFTALVAAATLFGALKGAFDVSVNAPAIAIENAAGRPVMGTFQALWSIGGLVSALITGIALHQGIAPMAIALTVSVTLLLTVSLSARWLMKGDAAGPQAREGFKLPNGRLLRIGILACMALFAEGVMMDWSAVYSRSVAGAAEWLAPLAYGVFCCCMAAGRLSGDALVARFGSTTILRLSGLSTTLGLLVIVAVHYWPATFLGLAFAGIGLANMVPILFGAGGRAHEGGVGKGLATVSMMGYFGFLAGPPVIGGASHFIGLPGAFALVLLFSAFIVARGRSFLEPTP